MSSEQFRSGVVEDHSSRARPRLIIPTGDDAGITVPLQTFVLPEIMHGFFITKDAGSAKELLHMSLRFQLNSLCKHCRFKQRRVLFPMLKNSLRPCPGL